MDALVAMTARIQGLIDAGRLAEATAACIQMVVAAPRWPHAWLSTADTALAAGQPALALNASYGAVVLAPATAAHHDVLVRSAMETGKFDIADAAARHLLSLGQRAVAFHEYGRRLD